MTITRNDREPADIGALVLAAPPIVFEGPRPTAADILDAAAARIGRYGWYTGSGFYAHPAHIRVDPEWRPAWGSTHILFAAGAQLRQWRTAPTNVPAVATEALEQLAAYLYERAADDDRREDSDGYLDVEGQIEAFESAEGMTAAEVAQTWRDCANTIRARRLVSAAGAR